MKSSTVSKLHPSRYPNIPAKLVSVISYILGQNWSKPPILDITITEDGRVWAKYPEDEMQGKEKVFGRHIADANVFRKNWEEFLDFAAKWNGLTPSERQEADAAYRNRVFDFRVPKWEGEIFFDESGSPQWPEN